MKIVTKQHDIADCLPRPNVTFNRYDANTRRDGRNTFNVTLRVVDSSGPYARRSYTGRKMVSCCYHGHYAFMESLYERDPDAVIQSAMATYRGRDDFESNAWKAGDRNIGSMASPVLHDDACECSA